MSRRVRLLCYIGSLAPGGAERQVVQLLRHIDRTRFEPMLLLAHRQGSLLTEVPADVPVYEATPSRWWNFPGGRRWGRILAFAHWLRVLQIDVVYDRTYLATLDAACACWLARVPRVSAAVADPAVQFRMYARRPRWLWYRCSRWAYRSAQRVLANSQGLREQLLQFWRLPDSQVSVQPNAFDFVRMDELACAPAPDIPPGRLVLLTVGRIDADKGHRDLLAAVEQLVTQQGPLPLLWRIVGDGPDRAALEQEVQRLHLNDYAVFTGSVDNPYPEYCAADLFCLPSHSEGLPNVLIEALACGVPVISTDCPSGPREILQEGRWGTLVPVRDPQRLAEALLTTMRDFPRCQQRAAAAKEYVRATYSAQHVFASLEQWLSDAADVR